MKGINNRRIKSNRHVLANVDCVNMVCSVRYLSTKITTISQIKRPGAGMMPRVLQEKERKSSFDSRTKHGACMVTLGLIECQTTSFMSLESADSHNSDVLREKIETKKCVICSL